jgi:hypothetical protein
VQQIRLWIYCILLVLIVARTWSHRGSLAEFVMFCLVGALFYLEICPVCGRLCWWEIDALRRWPNALWIGSDCRRRPTETDHCSSEPERG